MFVCKLIKLNWNTLQFIPVVCALYAQRSAYPPFMETLDEQDPWHDKPCWLRVLPYNRDSPASYFKPDVWHTVNLGVGRSWVANCIVLLVRLLGEFQELNIEQAMASLSGSYVAFCAGSEPRLNAVRVTRCSAFYLPILALNCNCLGRGSPGILHNVLFTLIGA